MIANAVHAQMVEEVIVTAQKREQSSQDVGIAITAFSREQLERLRFEESTDIARLTPGLFISPNEGGLKQLFTVRGVNQNDFAGQTEAPVAVYVDDSYVAVHQGQLFGMYDIDRVEVLKGPQGTLFGRNATGGLIHFVSRKPTREAEGFMDLTYGSYKQVRVKAALGGPLTETLSARAALMYSRNDEVLENTYPDKFVNNTGAPLSYGGEDSWNDDTLGLRAHLLFEPTENVNFLLSGEYSRVRMGTPPFVEVPSVPVFNAAGQQIDTIEAAPGETRQGIGPGGVAVNVPTSFRGDGLRPVPGGTFYGATCTPAGVKDLKCPADYAFEDLNEDNLWSATGKLSWKFDDFTLTAVSAYRHLDTFHALDADGGPATTLSASNGLRRAATFTQELRLNGELERFRWVAGGYYLNVDSSPQFSLGVPAESLWQPLFGAPSALAVTSELSTNSRSVFGQVEYDLTGTLTFIAGARVIFEDKHFNFEEAIFLEPDPRVLNLDTKLAVLNPRQSFEQSDTLWSGKLQVNWHPTDALLLYAGVNRGVKAGGFNALVTFGAPFPASDIPYDGEVLLAYETGFKSDLLDGSLRLNGSFYYYDYNDYQGFIFRNATSFIRNADAKYKGAELELTTSPLKGLDVAFNVGYLDAQVNDVQIETGVFRDTRPSFAPEWQFSGLFRYEWQTPVFGGRVSGQADFNHVSSFFTDLRNFQKAHLDAYTLTNVALGWGSLDGKWQTSLFANNVTDEKYRTTSIDLAGLFGSSEEVPGRPRWFGLSVKYKFF